MTKNWRWSLTDNIFWSGDTWPFPVVFSHPRNTIWRPHKITQKMITEVFFSQQKWCFHKIRSPLIHIKSTWIYLVLWSIWLLWAWLMEALGHIWLLPGLAEDCHGPIVHCHRSKYVITDSQVNLKELQEVLMKICQSSEHYVQNQNKVNSVTFTVDDPIKKQSWTVGGKGRY